MKKVITIGGATQDIFVCQDNPHMASLETAHGEQTFLALQEGCKIDVTHLDYRVGGGATNSAVSFARLDFDVSCCIKIGDDLQGAAVCHNLAESHVNTICTYGTTRTGTSFILPTISKDRVVLVWRGANAELTFADIDLLSLQKNDAVYITSLTGAASNALLSIVQYAKKHNTVVATNPGTSQLSVGTNTLVQAFAYIDILILNSYEATLCMQSLVNQDLISMSQNSTQDINAKQPELFTKLLLYKDRLLTIKDFMSSVHALGPQIVVVTNGAEGIYIATEKELLFHASLPTNICNTLGAGDAFGSCFTAHILHGDTIKEAAFKGLLNAQSVISHLDAKSGLLTTKQLMQLYAQHAHAQNFYSCA